jgi:deaminated glutathione amidase
MEEMGEMTKIAALQFVSTPVPQENFATAHRLVADAADRGAGLVLMPEYWPIMGMQDADKLSYAEQLGAGPIQDCMADLAHKHGIWLIGGTLPLMSPEDGKVMNTLLVYSPSGERVSRYDKIHLFGFTKGDESYDESRTIVPGAAVGTFDAPFGKVGLSVCYDLRFPELYRAMGDCTLIVVPAAFTYTTGKAHWEILLRARAIENQCYILAAAQGGKHVNGRRTWGHSMLVDPWGEIQVVLPEGEGIIVGEIDQTLIARVRENLPALRHRKL